MKKKVSIITVVAIAAVIWIGVRYTRSGVTASDTVWVQASTVKIMALPQEVRAIGTLTARSVEITPEQAGHVNKILFQDGAWVQKDTPLIQLDDAVYKAKYESAKAKLTYSENNFKRMVFLGKRGAIAKQAIDQAEADLKERRADADESQVILSKMTLNAPFDGTVGKSKINPGDYVTIGQGIVSLTDTKHLRIEYNVPERFLPLLKLGQTVSVMTSAYPDKVFTGKLSFISPTITADNRSVSLYADVENDTQSLAPGMFVNITQSLGSQEKVVMVPARSLVPMLDGEQVYKVVDGKAYAVNVVIGQRINDNVQIVQGLSPQDVVITDGQLKVKNGVSVKIKS